jgi:beta-lactamase class A
VAHEHAWILADNGPVRRLIAGALLFGALPAGAGGLPERARAGLEERLRAIVAEGGAGWGIYFRDLSGGAAIAINADAPMHAASTMKTAVMLEALRSVDEGALRLGDELPVKNEFPSLVDGSPFSIGLDPAVEGELLPLLGGNASVELLMREMIVRSSNLAANILLTRLTPAGVQRFADRLGAPSVKVRRCLEDGKAYAAGINNETDARGMGRLMEAARRSRRLSRAARERAWQTLLGQTFNEQIPAGLPEGSGALVAHKTGTISSVQHDAAVVRLADGREYVLVLLANDFGASEDGRKRVIEQTRRMSRAVFEAMSAR